MLRKREGDGPFYASDAVDPIQFIPALQFPVVNLVSTLLPDFLSMKYERRKINCCYKMDSQCAQNSKVQRNLKLIYEKWTLGTKNLNECKNKWE